MSAYPPPPWTLRGEAILLPVRLAARRIRLPTPLVPLAIGRHAFGLVVLARYGPDSTLAYQEMALLVAARAGRRIGFHAARLWVDEPASIAGGAGIWGLAKESAAFRWAQGEAGPRVDVADRSGFRLRVRARKARCLLPRVVLPGFQVLLPDGGRVERFRVALRGRLGISRILCRPDPAEPTAAWTTRGPPPGSLAPGGARRRTGVVLLDMEAEVHARRQL